MGHVDLGIVNDEAVRLEQVDEIPGNHPFVSYVMAQAAPSRDGKKHEILMMN